MTIMVWTPIVAALYVCSSLATFMTMVHLRFRWDVHASSFRWLFWLFFTYLWIWCVFRSAYMLWKCTLPNHGIIDRENRSWTYADLDRLGVHAVLQLQVAHEAWMTCLLVAGDVALLGLALTTFPLTYELAAIARMSMDRGVVKEQAMTRRYSWCIHSILIIFTIAELTISIVYGGYTKHTHQCILGVYIIQFVGLAYMVFQLVCLKVHGRKYETIHGTFVASPVYRRLKTIMTIYVFFSFQFQLSYFIFQIADAPNNDSVTKYMGITLIIYAASGLALAITTSCSQSCVLSACSTCLSDEFEVHYLHQRYALHKDAPCEADFIAPSGNPIFVFTDIDSSSALWALECSELMEQATEIHDRILRTALPEHRGYEIATCGDAFQVAFHTIQDAIEYCVDVQLQLLVAKWPKELATVGIPATARQRCGRRLVFNGLRVRMGIHDAHDSEGVLIQDSHVITGKTTYIGASEVIAAFVGDLGAGGQILVTERIATWLQQHLTSISVDCTVDRLGLYTVPQVSTQIEVYQVLPLPLVGRKSLFSVPSDPPIPRREGSASRSLRRMAAMSQSRIGYVPIEQMA